ncbi:MAG: hypothetical protein QNJ97_21020 [Myxococcota bacterium]|nr:hypothetical protein [Myxococcota bacterium]
MIRVSFFAALYKIAIFVFLLSSIACGSSSRDQNGSGDSDGDSDNDSDGDSDTDTDADSDTDADTDTDTDSDSDTDTDTDTDTDSDTDSDSDTDTDTDTEGEGCGYQGEGSVLMVAPTIEICLPKVVCTSETCPPGMGTCVDGRCVFADGYDGLKTLPSAWATHYCDLTTAACHGVTQFNYPEETAAMISAKLGYPLCAAAGPGDTTCIGIVASSPMVVGNSQEAVDPETGQQVALWGLGMTEATGGCYEVTGPGGTAVVAVTDRCGGYCSCNGSGVQECAPCVNAPDMKPNCGCVGAAPPVWDDCCGPSHAGCGMATDSACDWCASNNHPHFDLDTHSFEWVCGNEAIQGSCELSAVRYVDCIEANPDWPPGGGVCLAEDGMFDCNGVSPGPEQPLVPDSNCCCNWGLTYDPAQEKCV